MDEGYKVWNRQIPPACLRARLGTPPPTTLHIAFMNNPVYGTRGLRMSVNMEIPEETAPDAVLIERTLNGDGYAFARLVQRYKKPVLRRIHRLLGYSADDDDAVQEVFLRAYKGLRGFKTILEFGPWIGRIAANYCIDLQRRARRQRVEVVSQMKEADRRRVDEATGDDVRCDCRPEACKKLLDTLMEELKPRYRAAIVLRDLEGRDYSEVARTLGISVINARVMVSRARRRIQQEFRGRLSTSSEYVL